MKLDVNDLALIRSLVAEHGKPAAAAELGVTEQELRAFLASHERRRS